MCVLEEKETIFFTLSKRLRFSGETLRNDDFNASYILSGTPPILGEQLLVEWRIANYHDFRSCRTLVAMLR
jgi:hypothetical protein